MNRKLDVLFVTPHSAKKVYQDLSDKFTAIETPTWSLLLANACRLKGYGVAILDCDAERLSDEEAVKRTAEIDPRLVVIVVYGQNPNSGTTMMTNAITYCKLLKESYPEYKTCFVGSHTSALPKEVLAYSYVDFVLLNEGVYALRNLLMTDLENDLQLVKGIGWKDDGRLILNTPQSTVPQEKMDIDMPSIGDSWDLLPYKEKPLDLYRSHFWHAEFNYDNRTPAAALYTNLGCSYKCQFCLEADTTMTVFNGRNKKAKDITKSDQLVAYDEKIGDITEVNIVEIASRQVDELYEVSLSNGKSIKLTGEHPLYKEGKWVETKDLNVNDKILVINPMDKISLQTKRAVTNCPHYVEIIEIKQIKGDFTVYNFQCDPHNNYFAENILTHNCMINLINRVNNDDNTTAADSNVMRFWSPELVIQQFDRLVKLGVKTIRISDELFLLNKKYYEPILKLIVERGYGKFLKLWVYSRVDSVNERFLDLVREAGIIYLALGIESGNQSVRREITKGSFKDVNIRHIVKEIRNHGINVIANYIYGLETDTFETMQQTLDLSLELNTEMMNCYSCAALPGSPLHLLAKQRGWALPDSYEGYSFHSYECLPMRTETLTAAEVLKFRDDAWNKYFTNENYLNLVEKKFGIQARQNVVEMSKIKLKRKILGD